ncbi:homeodomain-interacting protein kinase 2-like [Notolabrus celidotus]|uniref:homeodomain-interacting protein kinase 2-like n=1 Tax=Notolabrus celidotus TaxID=1203425 RepID=UPI00148FE20C|nr:homeodomain-interacting protein kinase 2-like [Notolabrus celidotus]
MCRCRAELVTVNERAELGVFRGSLLGDSHRVESFLGEGGFGVVAKCRNTITDKYVAIKVNKNDPDIFRQARKEIAVLKKLRSLDPETCNIVRWHGFFFNKYNICLNFELMDLLHYFIRDGEDRWLSMTEVRAVISQMASALSHLGSLGIVHGDIKPDNIMVVDRHKKPLQVKLIDFGLACPVSACEPGMCVQTICYRAPEVSLHGPFNEAIDIWSLGLTAAEMITGCPLYPGEMDYDVLSYIIETQGHPEDDVLEQGMATEHFFNYQSDCPRHWSFKGPEEYKYDTGDTPSDMRYIHFRSLDDLEELMEQQRGPHSDHRLLVDLIKRMLPWDQKQRIKPLEVLQHPFLTESPPQNSCSDVIIDMMDPEDVMYEDSQELSGNQTAGPEDQQSRFQRRTTSLTAETVVTMIEEEEIQPERRAENVGWFRRVVNWITEKFRFSPPQSSCAADVSIDMTNAEEAMSEDSQELSWKHTAGPENQHSRIQRRTAVRTQAVKMGRCSLREELIS